MQQDRIQRDPVQMPQARAIERRDFLVGACTTLAGAGVLAGLNQLGVRATEPQRATSRNGNHRQPKIDTHQHLWDLERFRLPWTDGNELLGRSYLSSHYLEAIEETGIDWAVYMEVGMEQSQQAEEAAWLVDLCRRRDTRTLAGVIAGQPFAEEFEAYARKFASEKSVKGVRHLLHTADAPPGTCRTPEYRRGVQLLGELGLRFDLCVRPQELHDAFVLAQECPETRMVLDHCGNADVVAFVAADQRWREAGHDADQWRREIERLASLDNVVCKISGIIARVQPEQWQPEQLAPIVNHCLDCFGEERVMFASDWPVCLLGASLAKWVEALEQITAERSDSFRQALFHDNAMRFYDLELPAERP